MDAKEFLEKYDINTDELIYSTNEEAHRLVDLMNGFIKEVQELKKLPIHDVIGSVCVACGKAMKDFNEETNNCCDECWLTL